MKLNYEYLCAWSGIAFVVIFAVGWWGIASYVPPLSPSLDAKSVSDFYATNNFSIKIGLTVVMFGMIFLVPFMALITLQMARIEGNRPILTVINIISGTINIMYFIIPLGIWMAASFRSPRDVELVQIFNDFGWMFMLWPVSLTTLQNCAIGVCILSDKRNPPLIPRWAGFLSIYVGFIVIPGGIIPFFKDGPFAWNGVLAFWMVASVYLAWIVAMSAVLHRSVSLSAKET